MTWTQDSVGIVSLDEDVVITGSLTTDSIKINGSTVGLTTDTDLLSLADGALTVNGTIASGVITANVTGNVTGDVTGDLTGDVTGNCSGTAATVTGAAQTNITSVGTLTALIVNTGVGLSVTNESNTDNGSSRINFTPYSSNSQNRWEARAGGLADSFKIHCTTGENSPFLNFNQSAGSFVGGTIFDITTTTGGSAIATVTFDASNEANDTDCFFFKDGNVNLEGSLIINGSVGFYGTTPISQASALTTVDNSGINNIYDVTEKDVLNNVRTRLNEIETLLTSYGLIST